MEPEDILETDFDDNMENNLEKNSENNENQKSLLDDIMDEEDFDEKDEKEANEQEIHEKDEPYKKIIEPEITTSPAKKQKTDVEPKSQVQTAAISTTSKKPVRYFVIKSFSQSHLDISISKQVWATQPHNENKFLNAYNSSEVILIFSVNNSGHFQGYCRMASAPGEYNISSNVWTEVGSKALTKNFKVEWLKLYP